MRMIASLIVAGVALLGADAASACQGQKVLYQDRFTALDPSWGTYGDELTIENGRMVIRPEPGTVYWQGNDLGMYRDADLCADVTIVESVTPDEVVAGLVFWYVDLEREVVPWAETALVPMGD